MNINSNNKVFRGARNYLEDFNQPYMNESTDFIIQSCLKNKDEKIYVCAIGCLTNIASALLIEPKIIKNLVVVWTSGFPSYSPLNNKPSLNLVQDVKASQLVFSCGVSVVYLPGFNVGEQLTISLPEMNEFVKGKKVIIELGSGNGASKDILNNKNIILTDIQKYSWISKKIDMNKLKFEKKYIKNVDVFILNQALHHCANPTKLLKKMLSYLKKGGYVLIREPEISFSLRLLLVILDDEAWSFNVNIFRSNHSS